MQKLKRHFIEKMFETYPDVVSPEEVQQMLRIGRNKTFKLLKQGDIETIRVGKKYIIPKIAVINFLIRSR